MTLLHLRIFQPPTFQINLHVITYLRTNSQSGRPESRRSSQPAGISNPRPGLLGRTNGYHSHGSGANKPSAGGPTIPPGPILYSVLPAPHRRRGPLDVNGRIAPRSGLPNSRFGNSTLNRTQISVPGSFLLSLFPHSSPPPRSRVSYPSPRPGLHHPDHRRPARGGQPLPAA